MFSLILIRYKKKTTASAVLKIAQGKQSITENMTAYGFCQCFGFIIIPVCRAECFHISAALGYALLTVSHLTPAGGPGGLWEEVPAQKLVVSEMWCNIWVFLKEDRFQISSL